MPEPFVSSARKREEYTTDRLNRVGADRDASLVRIRQIIRSYDEFIIRAYCRIRFIIMRIRFLEELDQYIPRDGTIVDLGCGFGLFSLYFASTGRGRRMFGVDLNEKRIAVARRSAARLDLSNASYKMGDAAEQPVPAGATCVYMLDLLHHLPEEEVRPLLSRIHVALARDGILLIKDVDTRPAYKRWFTLVLDRLMVGLEPIRYWSASEMIGLLEEVGFQVYTHEMRDILPYPHRLYVCRKV